MSKFGQVKPPPLCPEKENNSPPLPENGDEAKLRMKWESWERIKELKGREKERKDEWEESKDILEKRVCHKKSKDEIRKEKEERDTNIDDFRTRKLRMMVSNVRGWFSKKESAEAIFIANKVDIILLSETLMTASRFPELVGFTTYHRNRTSRGGGGIAIMLRNEVAKFAVRVDVGALENEYLAIKLTNTSPNLLLIVYYGVQSGTYGSDQVKLHLSELFDVVKKHQDLGCAINLCGDFNLHIGDELLKNNHPEECR